MLYYEFKAQIARGEIAPLYRIDGEDRTLPVRSGFARVKDNLVTACVEI